MAKITITRIGQEKTINYLNKKKKTHEHPDGTPDSFKKIGVQTNEYGDRWIDITFRGEVPVKVGQSYEAELSEREYNGKTYYDAKLPRENRSGGGMSNEMSQKIYSEIFAARQEIVMVRQLLEAKEIIPSAKPVASGIEYPASTGPSAFDDDPANDPNFDPFGGM